MSFAFTALALQPAIAASKAAASGGACSQQQRQQEQLERSGQLLQARQAASACAKPACGALIAQQCAARLQALDASIPSVVPIAVDEAGAPVEVLEVRVDGIVRSTQLDGRAIELEPGLHEFEFSAQGHQPYAEKLLVVQGERNRRLSAVLRSASGASARESNAASAAPEIPPPPAATTSAEPAPAPIRASSSTVESAPSHGSSVWPFIIGGVGLAALGTSVAFATWGHTDLQLLDRCAPNCSQDSVDHVRHMYIAADISLGIGVVAVGVASWLYLSQPGSREQGADAAARHFDLRAGKRGAFATWEQTF